MFLVGVSGNDPKNDFELFLQTYAWIICVALVLIIIGIIALIIIRGKRKNKRTKIDADPDEWINALGGKDNLLSANAVGSRLSVQLINKDLINREALTKLGVSNIVMMSDKVTLVTKLDNKQIVEKMKNSLQK